MADETRIKIAAAVTALFLAGISAAGLTFRDHQPQRTAAQAVAAPVVTAAPAVGVDDSSEYSAEGGNDE
jgi:hypothetical protein